MAGGRSDDCRSLRLGLIEFATVESHRRKRRRSRVPERLPECPFNAAQRLGFSLAEVADLLQTGQHRHGHTDAGLQAHAAAKIAEIDARIDDLQVIRASLVTAMEAGCDDLMVARGRTPVLSSSPV